MQTMTEFNLASRTIWSSPKKSMHTPLPFVRSKHEINRQDIYDAIVDEYKTKFHQLMDLYYVYDPKPGHTYRRLSVKIPYNQTTFYLYFQVDLPTDLCNLLVSQPIFSYQHYQLQPSRMTFIRKRNYISVYDVGSDSRESSPEPF